MAWWKQYEEFISVDEHGVLNFKVPAKKSSQKDPKEPSSKRGRFKTAKGARDRYIQEWGGGADNLKKRIRNYLSARQTNETIKNLKDWLTDTWFAADFNRVAPTVQDVIDQFGDGLLNADQWTDVLKFQQIERKEKGSTNPAELKKTWKLALEPGEWHVKLQFQESERFTGGSNSWVNDEHWNREQPLVFLNTLRFYNRKWMNNILLATIPQILKIELNRLGSIEFLSHGFNNYSSEHEFDISALIVTKDRDPLMYPGRSPTEEESLLPLTTIAGRTLGEDRLQPEDFEEHEFQSDIGPKRFRLLRLKGGTPAQNGPYHVVVAFWIQPAEELGEHSYEEEESDTYTKPMAVYLYK